MLAGNSLEKTLDVQDPSGQYVKEWVPEIARLPKKYLHQPWQAPAEALEAAGVRLGETYPHRITGNKAMQVSVLLLSADSLGSLLEDSSCGRLSFAA